MSNDYDFILNNQPKRSGMGFMQNPKQKIVVIIGFVSVVLIVVIVLFNLLFNSGGASASSYIPITVYQEELIRILDERDELNDQSLIPKYTTLYLAVNSDYQASTAYLGRNGIKITPEQRSPYYYFDFESDLETAASANRFDAEFISYVDQAVSDYSTALIALNPTPGQAEIHEQAKQNIIYYNGRPPAETEE